MQSAPVAVLPTASWRAVGVGLLAVGLGLAAAVTTDLLSPGSAAVAAIGYLVAAALIGGQWHAPRFGLANAVTLTRLVGTCWVAGLTVEAALNGLPDGERLLLIALATACLLLDGIDGWVARARNETSDFGARFDVETDTLLLLCLSLAVPILDVAGWWTIAFAGLRYTYLAASLVVPALRLPLSSGLMVRKTIAVISVVSLIAALAVDLVWPGWAPTAILVPGLACLVWSFGSVVSWQLRRYRELTSRATRVR